MSALSQAFDDWSAGRISDQQLEDAEQAARQRRTVPEQIALAEDCPQRASYVPSDEPGDEEPSDEQLHALFDGMSEQEIILILIGDRLQDHEPPF